MMRVASEPPAKTAGTTLRGLTWDHPRAYSPLEAAAQEYVAKTGIKLTWHRRSLKEFGDQSLAELVRQYDVLVIDHPHVGIAAEQELLLPLDEYVDQHTLAELAKDSPGGSHQSYSYGGHQWALAIDAACQVAASRPDLSDGLASDGAVAQRIWPTTWDNVLRLAEQLRTKRQWMGVALCPTDCGCSFLTLMAQHGMPAREDRADLAPEAVIAALSTLAHLKKNAYPDSTLWNPVQLYEAMTECDDLVYSPLAFGYASYCCMGFRRVRLAFGPIPGRVGSLLGGAGIAVSRHTYNRAAAVGFATYVASEACQAGVYAQSGGQPAHARVWKTPVDVGLHQFIHGTRDTIQQAYTRPRSAWWTTFQPQLEQLVHDFLVRDLDSSLIAREINERYQQCREMT